MIKYKFLISILLNLILSLIWTYLSIVSDEFTKDDKGLITGLGYLLIFSLSLFITQPNLNFKKIFFLSFGIIVIFLISSFLLFIFLVQFTNSIMIYGVIASVLTSILLIVLLDKLFVVNGKFKMIFITFCVSMVAYYLMYIFKDKLNIEYNISPRMSMFLIFQGLLIIPLSLSIAKYKASI
jgi:hypothetical protein